MKQQVNMVMMSHLSDAQHLMESGFTLEANKCINFVKLLLITHNDDMSKEISEEEIANIWDKV